MRAEMKSHYCDFPCNLKHITPSFIVLLHNSYSVPTLRVLRCAALHLLSGVQEGRAGDSIYLSAVYLTELSVVAVLQRQIIS
jgi:hypothetical protein